MTLEKKNTSAANQSSGLANSTSEKITLGQSELRLKRQNRRIVSQNFGSKHGKIYKLLRSRLP
jgi:hypothetical protein